MIEYSMIAESFKFVDTENWSLLPRSRVFDRLFERSKVQMGAHRAGNGHPQGFQRAGRKPGRRITARTRRIYVSCAVTRARLVCYRKLQEAHQPRLADATWANDRGRISLARALEQRHAFAEPSIELAGGREQGTNKKDALNMRRSLRIYSGELLRGSRLDWDWRSGNSGSGYDGSRRGSIRICIGNIRREVDGDIRCARLFCRFVAFLLIIASYHLREPLPERILKILVGQGGFHKAKDGAEYYR